MTATAQTAYLPAIRPTKALLAVSTAKHSSSGFRRAQVHRLYRIPIRESRRANVYQHNAYILKEPAKGRHLDIFA